MVPLVDTVFHMEDGQLTDVPHENPLAAAQPVEIDEGYTD
jgi:hypothetical protein